MPVNGEGARLALDAGDLFARLDVSDVDEMILTSRGE